MSTVTEVADDYVARYAELDPVEATVIGLAGHDHAMTDLSPDGFAARAALSDATAAALETATADGPGETIARLAMRERLAVQRDMYRSGATTSDLNVIASWVQRIRQVFDLMPTTGPEAHRNLAARMAAVPAAYAGLRQTYAQAAARGQVAARRQVKACATQCEQWSAAGGGFYSGLVARTGATGLMLADLERAAAAASAATADLGEFLRTELLPVAPAADAAGRERYQLASRYFLGADIDLDEAYAWGWSEVRRIEAEIARVAGQIVPGGSLGDAIAALEADPARRITGRAALRDWMQGVADAAIAELDGTHFDIPGPARRIEAMIAPTSDGGIYYTGPSEDGSRPGRMWWALADGVEDFSTWKEVTTIYHEGVPGHHLQAAIAAFGAGHLNRWQRLMCWVSGHGEGWALYAERLMEELGYLDDPGDRLGLLDSQLLRAARVVVDLGVHLGLPVPADSSWHPGEIWDAGLAWDYLRQRVQVEDSMLRFELDRYLGWPGQAPSYKLGERIWLRARQEARGRQGAGFSLREFHGRALELGSMGLDPMREALASI
jgi:uncharacterized protein (DUF885 family)